MAEEILKTIKDEDIDFVDLRFTDPRGKMHHVTFDISMVDEDFFEDGAMFDGSSIEGWKAINESDMTLMPDTSVYQLDPFYQQPTLSVFCDVLEPNTGQPYERCPRSTAKRAESYLQQAGIGDSAFFGPEAEFFVFDDVRWNTSQDETGYALDSTELPANSGSHYEGGNMGHRPGPKGGYFPVPPIDSAQDLRSEMLAVMTELGLEPEKHHHEVAPAQHELGMKFSSLTEMADRMQLYKYIVHNVSAAFGKTATFMPKPMWNDNGSGMHVHQSIWKDGKPLFAGDRYADLSETCLHYIGGIIKHARAINAFSNASTNSYKRLVPGFEAPVLLAYSARNRSASIRVPHSPSPKGKRIEARFPDAAGNPYLIFTALLMAGLDGIENKIDPGSALDKNLYDLPPEELEGVPTVCRSLREALEALSDDREFLKKGGVMSDDQIDSYIDLKMEEVLRFETHPHPVEFDMYYKV
ncbi:MULTISPECIES: type I glutamate--ammonia ligase [Euryhalocaulis]|uniref:type I glutamate--ammonia ligase n=1 Tax=Euryhalocaulis TaxID=1712422 RepID=UPI00039F3B56|nr:MULTISPECIES: type I glutamate--ammonia ligase [Euryhalocaulis]MBA4800376.1 type I glutamate--ammonia ligase [Euryhalocaulis sp.]